MSLGILDLLLNRSHTRSGLRRRPFRLFPVVPRTPQPADCTAQGLADLMWLQRINNRIVSPDVDTQDSFTATDAATLERILDHLRGE